MLINTVYQKIEVKPTFVPGSHPFMEGPRVQMGIMDWLQDKVDFYNDLANQMFLNGNRIAVQFYLDVAFQYEELMERIGSMGMLELAQWCNTDGVQIIQ